MNKEDYINKVIGKPWENRAEGPESFDCWGLVVDSFRKIENIEVPQVDGYADSLCDTDIATIEEIKTGNWRPSQPCDGAVMVAYKNDRPIHVGRVICGGVIHAFGKNGHGSVKWNTFRVINSIFSKVEYYAYNHS